MSVDLLKMVRLKKSQIEMGETVAVLIIFFILLVLTFVYFTVIKAGEASDMIKEKQDKESIKITQEATFLPELACSHEGVIRNDCFDLLKLQAFEDVKDEAQLLYFDRLLFSKIVVHNVYPGSDDTWVIYDKPNDEYHGATVTQIPISLMNTTSKGKEQYSFGYVEVTYYFKTLSR